jgi:hypothetical protein
MDAHYAHWIPEHLAWRWLRGEPLARDTLWYADEWVGPMRINTRFKVVESELERLFAFRILGFPAGLVRTGGSFRFNPVARGGCEMVQEAHFGFPLPIVGALFDLLLRLVLPINEFRRHMRDEGEGMIRLIENGHDTSS